MRKLALLIFLALAAAPLDAWSASAEQGAPVGTVSRLRGEASAEFGGKSRTLAQDAAVELGDRLHTGDGARLEVKFLDGSVLTLGERADFTIDSFAIGGNNGEELFTRTAGAIRFLGGQIAEKQQHKIEIASVAGTIGIRGTDVWGGTVKTGSLLDVFLVEGTVEVRTAAGTVVLDKPGLGTSVTTQGGAPEAPSAWQPALRDRALATVSFTSP